MISEKKRGVFAKLLLVLATVIWGASFFILKNAIEELPTFFVLAVRFSMGAGVVALIYIKSVLKLNKKALLHGAVLGVILAAAYTLQTLGLRETTPSKNAFLTTAYVIFTPFLAWLFLKKKPYWNNIVAAVLCVGGVGLVSLDGAFHVERGDYLTLACGLFYALQIIFIKRFASDDDAGQLLFSELITAAIIFWAVSLSAEKIPSHLNSSVILPILYLGIVATGLAQFFQLTGQKYTSTSSASLILGLEAVFGTIFSVIFYRERITLRLGFGFAVIFIAILFSEIDWRKLSKKLMKNRLSDKENNEENG